MKSNKRHTSGFTLVELITALMISFIILTAIVTFAYALSSSYKSTLNMNDKQAKIRYTTLRISDLIRNCKLVCAAYPTELVIWRADDNNDNLINVSEIVYIETGYYGTYIKLLEFNPSDSASDIYLSLLLLQRWNLKSWLIYRYTESYTTLIDRCRNLRISYDNTPPYTRFINITFNIEENGLERTYQLSSTLRCQNDQSY